ncbi:MAG: hypothetical protein QG622_3516 [Actinomycetota bacterium]|nr:hypothetical protein [Actinomycetota bacterium]
MTTARLEAAKRAVAVVFAVSGFAFASWVSRLPAVRDVLGMTPSALGTLLLAVALGSLPAMFLAGWLIERLGSRRACLTGVLVMASCLAFASTTPAVPVMAVALAVVGAGTGLCDVAMNVEGAGVERLLGRSVMPRFHAGYSLGTVAGASAGAVAAAGELSLVRHLGVVAAISFVAVALAVPHFVGAEVWNWHPDGDQASPAAGPSAGNGPRGILAAWREPRTLLIGFVALGAAFAEGTANDWLALGLVDGYGVGHAVAALGFAGLVGAMTLARMAAPAVLDRVGRVTAVRLCAVLVTVGVLTLQLGPTLLAVAGPAAALVPAVVGILAWGLGASLGFPLAMSAASDDPRHAAVRVSVVSTIGYLAFIAGPPLLGLLGDSIGVLRATTGAGIAVLLSLVAAGAVRPPAPVPDARELVPAGRAG